MDWISIKNGLPEDNDDVIIYWPRWKLVCVGHYDKTDDSWRMDYDESSNEIEVTHWMPFPPPPQKIIN